MYRPLILIALLTIRYSSFGQNVEKIEIPNGVVYNYCKPKLLENAKEIVKKTIADSTDYALCDKIMFIGPVLWTRIKNAISVQNIEGGKLTLLVDDKQLEGKLTQSIEDGKTIWALIRKEIAGKEFTLRKAKPRELRYYWSVISFDIEEPLIIVETPEHKYILNISPKSMKLLWLDEVPF